MATVLALLREVMVPGGWAAVVGLVITALLRPLLLQLGQTLVQRLRIGLWLRKLRRVGVSTRQCRLLVLEAAQRDLGGPREPGEPPPPVRPDTLAS